MDVCDEHAAGHGFDQVIVCPSIQDAGDYMRVVDRRQGQDRDIAEGPQGNTHVPAIAIRQQQVKDDDAWFEVPAEPEPLLARSSSYDVEPLRAKELAKEFNDARVVIDDQSSD
jgi:hypothetical protein